MALHEREFFNERPETRDYLIRVDDHVMCTRCRCTFDVPSHQSMVFL